MNLYGASGHARVIIDILENGQIKIENIYDDDEKVEEVVRIPGNEIRYFNRKGSFYYKYWK